MIQAMAAEVGFDMKIRVTEFATSLKEAEEGDFQAYLLGWCGRTDPDGNTYIFHKCNAPQNNRRTIATRRSTSCSTRRARSPISAERKAIYEKLTKIILEDSPIIYLYHRRVLIAHTAKLEGYTQMPDGLVRVVGLKLK